MLSYMFEFRAVCVIIAAMWVQRFAIEPGAWVAPILGAFVVLCLEGIQRRTEL